MTPSAMKSPPPDLPACYLADLSPEAEMTATLVEEAWYALQRNRQEHLARCTTESLIQDLAKAAARWLEEGSPFMQLALATGPKQLGFPQATLAAGLRQLFESITPLQLQTWVQQDLGHPARLDDFCAAGPDGAGRRLSRAVGPATLAHVTAGNIPAAPILSLVAGVLVRSAQFVKCAEGSSLIPRLFAHSVREVNPHLGACMEIAEWPRRRADLLEALIGPAECVTATGSDDAVARIRHACPITKRFVGYGHRVSFAYLAADALSRHSIATLMTAVATDVSAWNQLGCLSPHVVYVESGGELGAEEVAGHLASALQAMQETHPRGAISAQEAATVRSRRAFYEVRAAHASETRLWQSEDSTDWTVVYEADPLFQVSCLNRFVYVKSAQNIEAALQGADTVRRHVSTVALAGSEPRVRELATRLADWGATRICPIGCMQHPPVTWRHDGRPALAELVRWVDRETACAPHKTETRHHWNHPCS